MRLEGRGIGHRYDDKTWLFRHVDISVERGEVVGLVGPSGCGKTTLGRILADYINPLEGKVAVDGVDFPIRGVHPVQMVFQHPERAVNPRWKVERILRESGDVDEELLDALAIDRQWFGRRSVELSGGELQRICIARALSGGTHYLIADEMTTMLDAITQAQVWQAVMKVAQNRSLGILVVSHDRHLIKRLCDRIIDFQTIP